MPDYGARIVIEGETKQVVAEFEKLKRSLGEVADQTKKTKVQTSDLGAAWQKYTLAAAAVAGAIYGAKKAFDSTVGAVIAYNKSILDASRATGTSAEDFSRIVQAADDLGISMGQVESSLAMATKRGFAPSVESLADLADRVNAIASPTARAAELATIFGRNWAALDPLLQRGGAGIRALAASVNDGLVATDAEIKKTEEARLALDKLNDTWTGLKNTVALEAVPTITKGLENMNDVLSGNITFLEGSRRGFVEFFHILDGGRVDAINFLRDLAGVPPVIDDSARAADGAVSSLGYWEDQLRGMSGSVENAVAGLSQELSRGLPQIPSVFASAFAMPDPQSIIDQLKSTIEFVAAGGPEITAAAQTLQRALLSGDLSPEEAMPMLDDLAAAASSVSVAAGDASIWDAARQRANEWGIPIGQAKSDIEAAALAIDSIPRDIEINVHYLTSGLQGYQHGGSFTVPGSGSGDRPFMLGLEPGEVVDVTPKNETNNNNSRNVTVNVGSIGGQQDMAEFESMLRQSLRGVR